MSRHPYGIYYDETSPFIGYENSFGGAIAFQPSPNLYQSLEYNHTGFVRPSDHHAMYAVDIFNTTTTYQFNRYCFVRVILRYDGYSKNLLQDYLASLTVIPGTVMHIGYGGFSEKNAWTEDHWVPGSGRMYIMKRSFFFKASYLFNL